MISRTLIGKVRRSDATRRTKGEFGCAFIRVASSAGILSAGTGYGFSRSSPVPRDHFDFEKHAAELVDSYFKRLYRMPREVFYRLADLLKPHLERKTTRDKGKAASMSVCTMLAISLRYLAGAKCLDLAWPYRIGLPTVYEAINETLQAIDIALDNIKFPTTEEECKQAANGFQELRNSPIYGVIGAMDGIAIAIRAPTKRDCANPRAYYNRKGFFSICVQAVVSADYKVTYLSAKHAGSTHDSTAFQSTSLYNFLCLRPGGGENGLPTFASVAADDAYGNGSCIGRIMTPYSGHLSAARDTFNYFWSSLRILVEQVFGVIVARWGIFWSAMRCSLAKAAKIISVCCKLHNYLIDEQGQEVASNVPQQDDDNDVRGEPIVWLQNVLHTDSEAGRHIRHGSGARRDEVARLLHESGFVRPARRARS